MFETFNLYYFNGVLYNLSIETLKSFANLFTVSICGLVVFPYIISLTVLQGKLDFSAICANV